MSKQRLELFTDAVMAIIITIMVLDLRAPIAGGWRALASLLPAIGIYAVGFLLVAAAWTMHHHFFSKVQVINRTMMWMNFMYLFVLSLTPLLILTMAEHPKDTADAVAFLIVAYVGALCLTGFRLASKRSQANSPELLAWHRQRNRTVLIGVPIMAALVGLALISAVASMVGYAVVTVWLLSTF